MAYTQAQLTALDLAIATGTLEVEYDGKKIKYRSFTELMRIRNLMSAELAGSTAAVQRTTHVQFASE